MRKRVLIPPGPRRRGAPLGNRNALKHGRFTRERRALNAEVRAYIKKTRALANHLTQLARAAKMLAALERGSAAASRRAPAKAPPTALVLRTHLGGGISREKIVTPTSVGPRSPPAHRRKIIARLMQDEGAQGLILDRRASAAAGDAFVPYARPARFCGGARLTLGARTSLGILPETPSFFRK